MSTVERHHSRVCRSFNVIRSEASSRDDEATLQVAIEALNDSIGPNGLVSTLLVYGALLSLCLPTDPPSPSLHQRARALQVAIKFVTEYFAKSQVSAALKSQNGPRKLDVHKVPLGGHVLVYRPNTGRWDGPFSLLYKRDEDSTILMNHGPSKFRSTSLNPYYAPIFENTLAPQPNQNVVHLSFKTQCLSLSLVCFQTEWKNTNIA